MSSIERQFAFDLVLVFLFSLKCFPFDSRPQTSLGEGMLLKADREIGTDYQAEIQFPARDAGSLVAEVACGGFEATRVKPLI